jgi:FtsP/CotA-like multicopper oxidase with cupredoxin domain
MHSLVSKSLRATLLTLTLVLVVVAATPITSLRAQAPGEISIVCENETGPGAYDTTVTLTTADGYIGIPDGNTVYMWGYAYEGGAFQHPGPTLCFNQNDVVEITLANAGFSQLPSLADDVSVVFPGQTGVEVDTGSGFVPVQPQFSGLTLTSLAQPAAFGGSVTYRFTAGQAGTFIYQSGTDQQKQVQMGLFGAIIVRPSDGANFMYNWAFTQFNPANDYMMLLSEIDPDLHWAVEQGLPYDITLYHPRYWLINGRSFPDTIAPNDAEWLPTQPYGAFLHIEPRDAGLNPQPSAVRFLNVGMFSHPMHPHGDHIQVVGRDGRPLLGPLGENLSYAEFGPVIGAGQTKDTLYDWEQVQLEPGGIPDPIPTDVFEALNQFLLRPRDQNLMWGEWFSGSPYLGETTDRPTGVTAQGECGEYYHIWHSHALHEAANYESGFGGMITLERIDPPGGCLP